MSPSRKRFYLLCCANCFIVLCAVIANFFYLSQPSEATTRAEPIATAGTTPLRPSSPSPRLTPTPAPTAISDQSTRRSVVSGKTTPNSSPKPIAVTVSPSPVLVATPTPVVTPAPTSRLNQISYVIEKPDGTLRGTVTHSGGTVAEVTQAIVQQHQTSFVYEVTPQGWFVTEIAGVKQSPAQGYYWLYLINGQFGSKSVDKQTIKPGDQLTWRYIKT